MTVAEMLSRMSSAELTDWAAFERLEGTLGPARGDLHAAMICAVLANTNRPKGKRPHRPDDFMPRWDRPRATSPQAMAGMLKSLTQTLGGRIRRRDDQEA